MSVKFSKTSDKKNVEQIQFISRIQRKNNWNQLLFEIFVVAALEAITKVEHRILRKSKR